jgi:hypothetical protein
MLICRFGDGLTNCEVMLLDVSASRRVDALMNATWSFPVHSLLISELFWPTGEKEKAFLPHPVVKRGLDEYAEAYGVVKTDRRLEFKERAGSVKLALEFDGGVKKEFDVTPVQASVILLFDDDGNKEVGIEVVQEKLGSGVLEKIGATKYRVVETIDEDDDEDGDVPMGDPVVVSTGGEKAPTAQLDENQFKMASNFATGFLKNLGVGETGATAARIHENISGPPLSGMFTLTVDDTQGILERMVVEETLDFSSGVYSIAKS